MSRFTSNSSITDHRRVISRNTTSPLYHSEARFTPVFQDVDGREWNVYSGNDETDDEHRDRRMRRSRSGSTRQYYRSQVSMAGLPSYRKISLIYF